MFNLLRYECLHLARKYSTWLVLAICFFLATLVFKNLLNEFVRASQLAGGQGQFLGHISDDVIRPFWGWMLFFMALLVPLAPMIAISIEKANGSLNFWILHRFSFRHYLFGKWLAWTIIMTLMTLLLGLIPLSLIAITQPDLGLLFSGWLTVWLTSMFILTLSFLINLMWPYPALAFGITYATFIGLAFLPWLFPISMLKPYLHEMSFLTHSYSLMHGRLYANDLLYFVITISVFLGLCLKRIQNHFNHLQ